jgi:hypothetical protein
MTTGAIDEARLEEFMGQMVGYMTGGTACFSIWPGDELGLYAALARDGTRSVEELAGEVGCHPRLVREWLDGQAAAALSYAASTAVCTPNSLSQEVGLALGAQAGEARLRSVLQEAGFGRVRRAAETPLNLILDAKER